MGIGIGASTTNIRNSLNVYKLELPDDNNILPTFNVKDLMPYYGEDSRASLFSQLWGIDAEASIINIRNSIFIMENSNSRGLGTFETPNIFLFPSILSLVTILIWSYFYFRKICSLSQSSSCFI